MSRLARLSGLVRSQVFTKVAILGACVVLLYLSFPYFRDIRHIDQYFDSAEERPIEVFDYKDTFDEKRCFDSVTPAPNPIPKIVHVAWFDNPELTFMTYLTIRSAIVSIKPDHINLHYTSLNETNKWFLQVRDHVRLVQHDLGKEYTTQVQENWQIKHISDLFRLDTIHKEGGIYLDMDVLALRPFDNLLNSQKDVVLGHEGADRSELCNSVIVGRPGSQFIQRWRNSYSGNFSTDDWNYHSTILPKELSEHHPDEICTLSPTAFSWPTWTKRHIDYMHEYLSETEAKEFAKEVVTNNGRLLQSQMTYHEWSKIASSHLDRLDPESVMRDATRFNILARRFLN
ncbi:nucleotide-diphospho-sugar transferase [Penicillium argentinense]|uniref:Nucleotide-diphospho-sugar transferase n=1 Tax=Penicillium argentinense TaxID=1131581 RepID=A0A9W9FMU3_9EURO|nr:nucleotide-diphospho-sugar transferase [Penicillium argentinense]KAJ5103077.1 nucleotide-diphospho-sugar transferase [Penicillium argentinense]